MSRSISPRHNERKSRGFVIAAAALLLTLTLGGSAPAVIPGNAFFWGSLIGQSEEGSKPKLIFATKPDPLPVITNVIAISAGHNHDLAVTSNGSVYAWGLNSSSELGYPTQGGSAHVNPARVRGVGGAGFLSNIASVAAGAGFSLALARDGSVYSWGSNAHGTLGIGSTAAKSSYPVRVPLDDIVQIAAGSSHAVALQRDGVIRTWGSDSQGQLGNIGSNTDSRNPAVVVDYITPTGQRQRVSYKAIAANGNHTLAIAADDSRNLAGRVFAWGSNNFGESGCPTSGDVTGVRPLTLKCDGGSPDYLPASAISAGGFFGMAIRDGAVWTWGFNGDGVLGHDPQGHPDEPLPVPGLPPGITMIGGGVDEHAIAAAPTGPVFAWGNGEDGQLGDGRSGSNVRSPVPVVVAGLRSVQAISAGNFHNIAIVPGCINPSVTLAPERGPPGLVVRAEGVGFPRNAAVSLAWDRGIGVTKSKADANGHFVAGVLIFPRDLLELRTLKSTPCGTSTPFTVIPAPIQPSRFVGRR